MPLFVGAATLQFPALFLYSLTAGLFMIYFKLHNLSFILKNNLCVFAASVRAEEDDLDIDGTVEDDLGKSREGSKTDDEVVQRCVLLSVCVCVCVQLLT